MKAISQYTSANWCFGDSAGVNWANGGSIFPSGCDGLGGVCASISDINNNLLLYATAMRYGLFNLGLINRGCIYNGNNNRILGGDTIVGDGWYHDVLILPKSTIDSTFYVFSTHVTYPYGLYYSIVDLKLNNGQGQVIQKNVLLDTAAVFDGLTAVQHGNGRDWWLVYRTWDYQTNSYYYDFYVDLVNSYGIQPILAQNLAFAVNSGSGQILFNSKGDQCILVTWGGGIGLFSFDRCGGLFSNAQTIEPELPLTSHTPFYEGCALSSNDSVLYVISNQDPYHTASFLYQFDLFAPNIAASKTLIDSMPVDASPVGINLAPDGKIYISAAFIGAGTNYPYPDSCRNYINQNLSVINYPNNLGTACDFQQFSFYLGGRRTYYGLPNNPNYELGRWVSSPCDSLTPVDIPKHEEQFFQAWYNPEWQMAHINATDVKGKNATIQIFNLSGQLITQQNREIVNGYFTASVPLPGIALGVYIAELVNEEGKLSTKFVVK